jgi:hypothetical protein
MLIARRGIRGHSVLQDGFGHYRGCFLPGGVSDQ